MAVMLHIMLIVFLSLCIRKKEFIQPDGISITQLEEDIGRTKEMYAFSAIWSAISEGGIFIYSCSAQLISFEIESTSNRTRIYEYVPLTYHAGAATEFGALNSAIAASSTSQNVGQCVCFCC